MSSIPSAGKRRGWRGGEERDEDDGEHCGEPEGVAIETIALGAGEIEPEDGARNHGEEPVGVEGVEGVRQPAGGGEDALEVGFEEAPEGLLEIDHAGRVADCRGTFGDDVEPGDFVKDEAGEDGRELAGEGQPGVRPAGGGGTPGEQEARESDSHGDGRVADLDEGAQPNAGSHDARGETGHAPEREERNKEHGGKQHRLERVSGRVDPDGVDKFPHRRPPARELTPSAAPWIRTAYPLKQGLPSPQG
ncbi:MAG: hypothetical protein M5U18_10915 [Dehalococcoidia bacterium]|nr:hypothetical protein [Dehalococcoidia bacterium]